MCVRKDIYLQWKAREAAKVEYVRYEVDLCRGKRICAVKGEYDCRERRIYAMKGKFVSHDYVP